LRDILEFGKIEQLKIQPAAQQTRRKIVKNIGYFGHFFLKFLQKVAQKRTALEKLRSTILPFVFENA
jgi:hypothetical protein